MAIIEEQRTERGLALLFIIHDLELAAACCDRLAVMYAGEIVEEGTHVYEDPQHPYTKELLAARPSIETRSERLPVLQYNRAISQRNLLLKKMKYEGIHPLDEWDRQIAGFAASLVAKRLEALHKLSFLAGVLHKRLSRGTEMLNLTYVQPYGGGDRDHQTDPEWYYALLQRHLEEDVRRQATSVGPHRDDLIFSVGPADLRKYGSQGQQRTAVLALKLSELEYVKSETGEYPVLLLDDVMSELDPDRRQALLDFVRDRIQTFITTTEPGIFAGMAGCHPICIEQGRVLSHGGTQS